MKKLIQVVANLAFFATLTASAAADLEPVRGAGGAFSGSWLGRGQAIVKPGTPQAKSRSCSQIALQLEQQSQKLNLVSGQYVCEDLNATYGNAAFEIRNRTLWYRGNAVGSISERKLMLSVQDPNDETVFQLTLVPQEAGLDYLEEWLQQDTVLLRVSGHLQRVRSPIAH